MSSIVIIDYGMGNLRSVQKAFEHIGESAVISSDRNEIAAAERLVLPGVGAFRDAIAAIRHADLTGLICDHVQADKPFLGICLGLQLLLDHSLEDGDHEGLGIIPGVVKRFDLPAECTRFSHFSGARGQMMFSEWRRVWPWRIFCRHLWSHLKLQHRSGSKSWNAFGTSQGVNRFTVNGISME